MKRSRFKPALVVVGASAGGPSALSLLLGSLPADFPAAVVIVQHMDPPFACTLASWLAGQTRRDVRLAEPGEWPLPGQVLLAGRLQQHLVFTRWGQLDYTSEPSACDYRPSVDIFFRSVELLCVSEVIGVLLTGMGKDGAEGLKRLRAQGHYTIAQDRASSAVYGMPAAAAQLGAATEILALDRIGPRLVHLMKNTSRVHA